ncbi:hypothetical protein C8R42DRAFT_645825 [Lentinula raphanica]|nr:hypothetical protein C8R42DRAFT_645825 [Lentinula raphanica]
MYMYITESNSYSQKKFICGELMKNWQNCGLLASRPKPSQQEIAIVEWFHAVLHMILCQLYDFYALPQERCTGSKPLGLSPGQFVKNAYKYHIMHEVNGGEDNDEMEKCLEVVSWDEDELKLSLEDQARVPIVSDTQGNTVVTVLYSKTYQKEVK